MTTEEKTLNIDELDEKNIAFKCEQCGSKIVGPMRQVYEDIRGERKVEALQGVNEIFVTCPACGATKHVAYFNLSLAKIHDALIDERNPKRAARKLNHYHRAFDAFQEKVARLISKKISSGSEGVENAVSME